MDIAQIGFKADTNDLDKAAAKLDALTPAANKAQTASSKVMKSLDGVGTSSMAAAKAIASKTKIVLAAARADLDAANAALASVKANKNATASEIAYATAIKKRESALYAAAKAENSSAQLNASRTRATRGAAGGSNVVPIRKGQPTSTFNTGNIAAQFQDIGVTAAMGMNPLQIALQQGTQLSAVLATMESPLKGLAAGLKTVFSATALLTIGIIAIVAALLEMVNWVKVGKAVLNGLADALVVAAPYVLYLVGTLTLLYSRTIIVGIATLIWNIVLLGQTAVAAGLEMAVAWLAALGPIGLIIVAVAAVVAAFLIFRDEFAKILGVDLVKYLKIGVNYLIGGFVGAFNGIKAIWGQLPAAIGDIAIQAANAAIKGIEGMINASITAINGLIEHLPDWIKGKGEVITYKADFGEFDNEFAGAAAKAGVTLKKEIQGALNVDYVGAIGKGIDKGISVVAGKLRSLAAGLGADDKKKTGKTDEEKFADIVSGAERKIATLEAERAALGLTEQEAAKLKYTTELLNEAQQKNIDLSPEQSAKLKELASTMAEVEASTKHAKEQMDFMKDLGKSFFSDMRSGLQQGQSLWEAFGNAVSKILDKITDKLLDEVLDAVFQVGGSGGGGSGSGILQGIGSIIASFFADGGAFDGGVQKFAKGGSFSNSVVSSPTLFKFAKGTGMMGEAGPEAIMPLKKGSDGSLGVQMHGQSGTGGKPVQVTVNVINNSKAEAKTSQQSDNNNNVAIDVMIDEMVANKMNQSGSKINQAFKAQQSRQLVKR